MFLHLKTNRQVITPTTKAYQPYMLTNVGNKNIYILSSVVCILKYPFEGLAYSGYFLVLLLFLFYSLFDTD